MCSSITNVTIPIEPKQNFHFRYVKELNSSHGFLTGQLKLNEKPNGNAVYPTVKLLLPQNEHLDGNENKREFYVLCTLHNPDVNCLSPHVLMAIENASVNYEFIFQKMHDSIPNPLERFWELQEYIIVRLKTNVFKTALESKRREYQKLQLPMSFEAIKGNVDLNADKSVKVSGGLNVCLGFTIFERVNGTFHLYNETIYSNNIHHGDDLKIHHLCNKTGSIYGGETVTVLINLNSNLPVVVLITKVNTETTETEWRKEITIENKDIFGNHAITFQLPAYDGPSCSDDEIKVGIEVVVTGTTYKSNCEEFHYINDNVQRKKARASSSVTQGEDVVVTSTSMSSPVLLDYDNNTILRTISNQNMQFENQNNGFFDEILSDSSIDELINNLGTNNFDHDLFGNAFADLSDLNVFLSPNNQFVSKDRMLPLSQRDIKSTERNVVSKSPQSKYPLHKIKNKIDQIFKMPDGQEDIDIMGLAKKDGNSIFHEALANSEHFMHLYKMANKSPHKNLVLKARNKYRENLLHYSCRYNRSTCIRPLIGMGCRLNEQDSEGRTPLHTAMEFNHNDCILKIQQLLEDHSKYPKVEENLIKMFKVYSHRGCTVLHAAVIANRVELLQIMLKFCRKYNINVKECNVLGNDYSLQHLIVNHDLITMAKFIRHYIPYNLRVENYFLKFILMYWQRVYRIHQRKCYSN